MKTFRKPCTWPLTHALLAMGLIISVVGVLPIRPVIANNPDFTLAVSPTSATVQRGQSTSFHIGLTGLSGLTSIINVFAGISPNKQNGPTMKLAAYDIYISSTQTTGGTTLTVGTAKGTATTTYTLTITAHTITCPLCVSNSIYHSATITLTVT